MTRQQQIIDALITLGKATRPVIFIRKRAKLARVGSAGQFYYIGGNGGLRVGTSISNSVSLTDYVPKLLHRAALARGNPETLAINSAIVDEGLAREEEFERAAVVNVTGV